MAPIPPTFAERDMGPADDTMDVGDIIGRDAAALEKLGLAKTE